MRYTAKYLYTYEGSMYYGWKSLYRYLQYQGYSKISQRTIERLADGESVRGYDDLEGKLNRRLINVPTKEGDPNGTNSVGDTGTDQE